MQFTPQQLSGGPRFGPRTRIGNWQEEISMEESKLEVFQNRALSGSSSLRRQQSKMATCNEIVPHTFSEDGAIRFGDYVILEHSTSASILACDPTEDLFPGTNKFVVTGYLDTVIPRARNTFRIARPPRHLKNIEDDEGDPVLRVGQPFCLQCNESLLVNPGSNILCPPLFLCSTKKTERMATRSSNRQLVYMSANCDAEAIWQVTKPSKGRMDSSDRFLAQGMPVSNGEGYVLSHRQTNCYLTCDPRSSSKTEFGIELECFADRSSGNGKIGLLVSEFKGLSTSNTLTKPDSPGYVWSFVTAADPRSASDSRRLPEPATPNVLLGEMRSYIISRGVDGFWDLRTFLQKIDKKLSGANKIDRDDLREAITAWGCPFEGGYLNSLIDLIDGRKVGLVDWRDFLALVRGDLSDSRQDMLISMFSQMDRQGNGIISTNDLRDCFTGTNHPLVRNNGLTADEAFAHFLRCCHGSGASGRMVTYEMFCNYYADLSAAIDDDSFFEAVLQSDWSRA